MDIKGKTAIITGATGKLAGEIVLSLAEAGANCVCVYNKNTSQMKQLQTALKKLKVKSLFIQTDLTGAHNIEKVFACLEKFAKPQTLRHGSGRASSPKMLPCVLINAAAIFDKRPLGDVSSDYIHKTFDINFTVPMIMAQKFVELVRLKIKGKQKPFGKIINIADVTAEKPPAGFSVYCASKAALVAATKSLAKELTPDFTVNAVSPGIINWQKGTSAKLKKKILARIPAGRTGSPQEVAGAVKFLIENDYITGQVINIDGGGSI